MKAKMENMKADLYNVFVMGNASNMQLARVYVLVTVPALTLMAAVGLL